MDHAEFSLEELITYCSDAHSPQREAAWRQFLKRYKVFIYQVVTRRCLTWRVPRLRRQLSDVVNDIVCEVFAILCNSLSDFREVSDEKKFKLWLATISNRAVSYKTLGAV